MSEVNSLPPSEREQLTKQVAVLQKIAKARSAAQSLREKARKVTDSRERERMLREAYAKEVEARGQSKLAQRMQSGAWQGAAGGAGIGAGAGLGLGAVVGILVGGLVSLPTTGLGALLGTGVGAVHGPFITFGSGDKRWEDVKPEEVVDALESAQAGNSAQMQNADQSPTKKQPRKLEIRSRPPTERIATPNTSTCTTSFHNRGSNPDMDAQSVETASVASYVHPTVRKPRKIEVKSGVQNDDPCASSQAI